MYINSKADETKVWCYKPGERLLQWGQGVRDWRNYGKMLVTFSFLIWVLLIIVWEFILWPGSVQLWFEQFCMYVLFSFWKFLFQVFRDSKHQKLQLQNRVKAVKSSEDRRGIVAEAEDTPPSGLREYQQRALLQCSAPNLSWWKQLLKWRLFHQSWDEFVQIYTWIWQQKTVFSRL